jgi:anthranilate synthase/aminodeoxychorismate synthase-like glutamine amidotransferase
LHKLGSRDEKGGAGMILIDNYDSFTYNLVQYLRELGVEPKIFENDRITPAQLEKMDFERIIFSPGAGNPDGAGVCLEVIEKFHTTKKFLGVCLGHQCIAQFFGAQVVKAKEPVHGKTSRIFFDEGETLFASIPQGFDAARYHSLTVAPETITGDLIPIARTQDGINMALKHKKYPVFGIQFHPEAILTQHGHAILGNFLG